MSFSTRVIPTTSVSRPQLKSNQFENRVLHNNSQGKKQQVEDHHKIFKFSNNKTFVTTCNDILNAETSNVNFVCVTYGKYVLYDNHDICVLQYINGMNSRIKQPIAVPISTREPKGTVHQSVATPLKRIVAAESTNQKPRSTIRKQYEQISKTCKWWYSKITPPGYKWESKTSTVNVTPNGNDLLTGSRGTDLYSITLQDTSTPNRICLMAKASSSQAWLWHRRLSHINFDTINLLSKYDIVISLPKLKFVKDHFCSSCELGKAKCTSFKTKTTSSSKRHLQILHMELCSPMRVESFNGKKYVLVIVDDYSRYTWTHFLRSKDKTPKVLIDFLKLVQRGLHAQVRTVRTNKGTEFLNKTLHEYFAQEGIKHETSTARTPEQNGINRSLVIPRQEKTPYHIINGRKPSVKFFHIFGSLCYIIRDGENIDKMKEKDHVSSDPVPQCLTTALKHASLCPDPQSQENVPQAAETVTTSDELDLLFSLMFDELLNGTTQVLSKSSAVTTVDAPNQRQQQHITPSTSTTIAADTHSLNIQTTPETTSQAPVTPLKSDRQRNSSIGVRLHSTTIKI
ncbi:retrovirus-related pol polyprotein from transposon TNT 1-94 [Tanacetum coccineum]